MFGLHWLRTERLPRQMGRFYRILFEYRQKADYADLVVFSHDEVESWLGEARGFVERVSVEVRKQLKTSADTGGKPDSRSDEPA